MYKIFLSLLLILPISLFGKSIETDSTDFPAWYIINGDTIGVTFTIEQAQKIDNDLELLYLMEQKGASCDSLSVRYIRIIDEKDNTISFLQLKVNTLEDIINDKESQIGILLDKANNYEKDINLANSQLLKKDTIIVNKNLQIGELNKEVTKYKKQRNLAIGGGVVGIVTTILIFAFVK